MNCVIVQYYFIASPSIQEKATAAMKNLRSDSLLSMIDDFEILLREV
ncbi:MAG TPA: hypothetical protein PKK99_08770 [Bacteroidia bacterium]|nr:hypothetical protein [Bacteroidia bacterium]HNP99133.1 hypothetical protein [Bacteroidia bacterium]